MKGIKNKFYLIDGDKTKKEVVSDHYFLGSSPNAHLQVKGASDLHAMLFSRDSKLFILDLKTRQGTFVNGQFINETELLNDHMITINQSTYIVSIESSVEEFDETVNTITEDNTDVILLEQDADFKDQNYFFERFDSLETTKEITSTKVKNEVYHLKIELFYKKRLIDLQLLELTKGQIKISDKHLDHHTIVIPTVNETIQLFNYDNFQMTYIQNSFLNQDFFNEIKNFQEVSISQNDFTINIKLVKNEDKIQVLPWWKINSKEHSDLVKKFSLLFVPFLFLMLIKLPTIQKEDVIEAVIYKAPPKGAAEDTSQSSAGGSTANNTTVAKATTKSFSSNSLNFFKSSQSNVQVAAKSNQQNVNMVSATQTSGNAPSLGSGQSTGLSRGIAGYNSTGTGLGHKRGIDFNFEKTKTVVLGSMDPELLRKILQQYLPQFRHCYQMELAKDENLKGMLDLNFRIESSGKASKISISSSGKNFTTQGQGCMTKVLEIIPFPKPKGGGIVDVRQPLNFYAENG